MLQLSNLIATSHCCRLLDWHPHTSEFACIGCDIGVLMLAMVDGGSELKQFASCPRNSSVGKNDLCSRHLLAVMLRRDSNVVDRYNVYDKGTFLSIPITFWDSIDEVKSKAC